VTNRKDHWWELPLVIFGPAVVFLIVWAVGSAVSL